MSSSRGGWGQRTTQTQRRKSHTRDCATRTAAILAQFFHKWSSAIIRVKHHVIQSVSVQHGFGGSDAQIHSLPQTNNQLCTNLYPMTLYPMTLKPVERSQKVRLHALRATTLPARHH